MPPAPKRSAGLLVHRARPSAPIEVLLAHPGGPYWANQDDGAWSIPKGEYGPDEDALGAARREFAEELGVAAPDGETVALGEVKQRGGKTVTAWTIASVTPLEPVEQPLRAGVAAAVGRPTHVPRGRPGTLVHHRSGTREDPRRPAPVSRSAERTPRRTRRTLGLTARGYARFPDRVRA
jgi:ADP-ribose pyrophosphatase YjhB (NUDIX family)